MTSVIIPGVIKRSPAARIRTPSISSRGWRNALLYVFLHLSPRPPALKPGELSTDNTGTHDQENRHPDAKITPDLKQQIQLSKRQEGKQ